MKGWPRNAVFALLLATGASAEGCGKQGGTAGTGTGTATVTGGTGTATVTATATGGTGTATATDGSGTGTGTGGSGTGTDAGTEAPAGMIAIPAGIFLMGSRFGHGSPEERPMHEAIVGAFYLDRTEVTTKAYEACMVAGACSRPHEDHVYCNTKANTVKEYGDRSEHPINCVDYHQAEAYCAFVKKRLPTEREWEYAARGGAEQRHFSWGEEDPTTENACYMHRGSCAVASFKPGAFGLHDMSGNVWEWTSSWFGNYPAEPKAGTYRVYRGGSWSRRFPKWLSNMIRNRYLPGEWSASVGMRCAQDRLPLTCPEDAEPKDGDCVRARGKPTCEPAYAWNGNACTPGGGPSLPAAQPQEATSAAPAEDAPITRTRTPEHDPDCLAHWPKKPSAYKFSGATFHARNGPLEGAGCTRRDMGLTWTSACCP